jgi:hypothetical protein
LLCSHSDRLAPRSHINSDARLGLNRIQVLAKWRYLPLRPRAEAGRGPDAPAYEFRMAAARSLVRYPGLRSESRRHVAILTNNQTIKKYRWFSERLSLARTISIGAKPSYPRNMLGEQSCNWVDRAKDLWCELFHNKPMWPINGRYQCGSCFRYHVVRWERVAGREPTRQTARRSSSSAVISGPRFAVARLNLDEGTSD